MKPPLGDRGLISEDGYVLIPIQMLNFSFFLFGGLGSVLLVASQLVAFCFV